MAKISEMTSFEQRTSEPIGLQSDGAISSYSPEEFEAYKAKAKLVRQRGYDDAMAGLILEQDERYDVDYLDGYSAGREKFSGKNG